MVLLQFSQELPPVKVSNWVMVPKVVARIVNVDPHHRQTQGLKSIPIKKRGMTWIHPNIVKDEQWTIVVSNKKQKMENLDCHIISLEAEYDDIPTSLLANSEEEQIILMADPILACSTQSEKLYLKQYDAVNHASNN